MYRILAIILILAGVAMAQTSERVNRWLQDVQHGDANAAFWLGVAYGTGLDVNQDSAKALAWYFWSAMHRNAEAQNALGQIYDEGRGIKPDYARAALSYQSACENRPDHGGAGQGCTNLGLLYLEGRGVPRDDIEAYKYFKLAGTTGDVNLILVIRRMTETQVVVAEKLVEQWRQEHPEPPPGGDFR